MLPPVGRAAVVVLLFGSSALAGEASDPLSSPDPHVRAEAVKALRRGRPAESMPSLRRAARDPDPAVRQAAVLALGVVPGRAPIDALLGRFDDEAPPVRRAAVEAIGGRRDSRVLPALLVRLEDPSMEVRAAALDALVDLWNARAIPANVPAIGAAIDRQLQDHGFAAREAAIRAAATVGDRAVVTPLLDLLQDGPEASRIEVVRALGRLGARLPDGEIAGALVAGLDEDAWRAAAVEALAAIGAPAVPALLRRLEGDGDVAAVVDVLARVTDARALQPLLAETRRGRVPAHRLARALGALRDPRAEPALLAFLDERQPEARRAALAAFVRPGPFAQDAIAAATYDPDAEVRRAAVDACARAGIHAALPRLVELLNGADAALRVRAAQALGALGDARAIEPLLSAFAGAGGGAPARAIVGRTDEERRAIGDALALVCDERCAPRVQAAVIAARGSARAARLRTLGGVLRRALPGADDATRDLLLAEAESGDPARAAAALSALDVLADPAAARRLRHLVEGVAVEPAVRRAATQALGGVLEAPAAKAEAEEALWRALVDPVLRAEAAWALRRSPEARIRGALRAALADRDSAVRANAAAALFEAGDTVPAPTVERLLADPDPAVRANGALLPRAADETLERLAIADPNPAVRAAARRSLRLRSERTPSTQAGAARSFVVLHLRDPDGRPLAFAPYRLILPDGRVRCGVTDGIGSLHEERTPSGVIDVFLP